MEAQTYICDNTWAIMLDELNFARVFVKDNKQLSEFNMMDLTCLVEIMLHCQKFHYNINWKNDI